MSKLTSLSVALVVAPLSGCVFEESSVAGGEPECVEISRVELTEFSVVPGGFSQSVADYLSENTGLFEGQALITGDLEEPVSLLIGEAMTVVAVQQEVVYPAEADAEADGEGLDNLLCMAVVECPNLYEITTDIELRVGEDFFSVAEPGELIISEDQMTGTVEQSFTVSLPVSDELPGAETDLSIWDETAFVISAVFEEGAWSGEAGYAFLRELEEVSEGGYEQVARWVASPVVETEE